MYIHTEREREIVGSPAAARTACRPSPAGKDSNNDNTNMVMKM